MSINPVKHEVLIKQYSILDKSEIFGQFIFGGTHGCGGLAVITLDSQCLSQPRGVNGYGNLLGQPDRM